MMLTSAYPIPNHGLFELVRIGLIVDDHVANYWPKDKTSITDGPDRLFISLKESVSYVVRSLFDCNNEISWRLLSGPDSKVSASGGPSEAKNDSIIAHRKREVMERPNQLKGSRIIRNKSLGPTEKTSAMDLMPLKGA
jgi:hypothetical protein